MISESDFRRVEEAFGIELPELYKRLLADGSQPAGEIEWFDSAESLIEINTSLLDEDDWDPAYLAIATNGAGDYYCLELETSDVAFYSHEERDFDEVGPLSEWIANPTSPVAEPGFSSVVFGVIGCVAIALMLLVVFAAPPCGSCFADGSLRVCRRGLLPVRPASRG